MSRERRERLCVGLAPSAKIVSTRDVQRGRMSRSERGAIYHAEKQQTHSTRLPQRLFARCCS